MSKQVITFSIDESKIIENGERLASQLEKISLFLFNIKKEQEKISERVKNIEEVLHNGIEIQN